MTDAAVATSGLTKRFGQQVAVDAVDLLVPRGAVYGFLGPNGSGKTTTIRMLLGLVRPTSGRIELLGQPDARAGPARSLPRVGALVEGPAFHPYLSGRANLRRLDAADRYADPRTAGARIDAALDRVGLLAAATKRYRAYSLGMRQRLAIAARCCGPATCWCSTSRPTASTRRAPARCGTWSASLADEGTTVLVSSHLLSEVEQICTHVGVMHVGRLVAQGTVAELRSGAAPRARVRDRPAGGGRRAGHARARPDRRP